MGQGSHVRMIAGIDLSMKSVEIVLRQDGSRLATWESVPINVPAKVEHRDAECARDLARRFPTGSFWDDTWLCGIEYPFSMMGPGLGLKTVFGAIVALIPPRVHVIPLRATVWQRHFCGRSMPRKGVDRKPLIRARALEMGMPEEWSQDAADALGLSWVVERLNEEGLVPKIGQQADLLAHT